MRTIPAGDRAKGARAWLLGALACSLVAPVFAQERPTVEQLQQRLEALERRFGGEAARTTDGTGLDLATLDQRLRALERNLELQEEARVAKAKETPVVTAGAGGAAIKSGDGAYEFKLRGLVQGDARFFQDDDQLPANDSFLLRRVRPTLEGSLGKLVGFRSPPSSPATAPPWSMPTST